ncbi:MAG: hypothetical protein M3N25_00645 [Actinomycetota bacterium]|nr:hypothetical protein [Actinomycetota bacterium]MDP9019309.1 hypothetical protein [Actinomycetota bacterium]
MKNLLRRLSKADDPARREEIERQAADEIKAAGSTPPAEASSAAWGPTAADTDAGQPDGAPGPAAPNRRLTAQQRAAARKLQTQN